jgi:hypothetical protein
LQQVKHSNGSTHQNLKESETSQSAIDIGEDPQLIEDKKYTLSTREADSDEDNFDSELRKPRLRREVGGVKKVADALRKISRPEDEIVLHPKPR